MTHTQRLFRFAILPAALVAGLVIIGGVLVTGARPDTVAYLGCVEFNISPDFCR